MNGLEPLQKALDEFPYAQTAGEMEAWIRKFERLYSAFKEECERQVRACPLVPTLTMMSIMERSDFLAKHSVALDEWYADLKRFLALGKRTDEK